MANFGSAFLFIQILISMALLCSALEILFQLLITQKRWTQNHNTFTAVSFFIGLYGAIINFDSSLTGTFIMRMNKH